MCLLWIFEKDVFEENEDMMQEVRKQGFEAKYLEKLELYREDPPDTPLNIIVRCSLEFARSIKRKRPLWVPGAICDLNNFSCSKYYTYFGRYLLNKDYVLMPLQEAIRQKDMLFDILGGDGKIFVRPDSGFKYFTGKVLMKEEMNLEGFEYGFYYEDPSILILISSPKKVDAEWRFIVAKKEIISGCIYKSQHIPCKEAETYTEDARNLAAKIVLENWQPEIIYTIDICLSDKKLYVLELNAFSTSGLYVCDLKPIVKKASELAIMEWNEFHEQEK